MFDHVVIGVSDYAASKAFYLQALAPLGVAVLAENSLGLEMGNGGQASFAIFQSQDKPAPLHLAFAATTHEQVQAFHAAALAAGARDNGAPGIRAKYSPTYYAAFVIGPDGHNVEAVCHDPQP